MPVRRQQSTVAPVVTALLVINCFVYAVQYFDFNGWSELLLDRFALWPHNGPDAIRIGGRVFQIPPFEQWQLLSYGFLHGSPTHLMLNMFGLWMFGRPVEKLFGSMRFLGFYVLCLIGSAFTQLAYLSLQSELGGPTVGASGGLFGVLLAFGMMFPNHYVVPLFLPIPIKVKYAVLLYGLAELAFGVTGTWEGIAHFAHLGGMVAGLIVILAWGIRRPPDPPPRSA